MLREHKVYIVKERATGKVVYVGLSKQTLYRRFNGHVQRKNWKRDDYIIQLVQDELSQDQGVVLEELLIVQYKTREEGHNIAPMSKNGYSCKHSEEQKKKWSEMRKGKPFKNRQNRTMPNSPDHNRRIGEASSRKVICLNNGMVYPSATKAAKELGVHQTKVSAVCLGQRTHTKQYKFKYLDTL